MPFPFDVGNPPLQDKLDWVAQPLPQLPTDLYRRRDEQPAEGEHDGNGIPTE
jgi:hypothetical protein